MTQPPLTPHEVFTPGARAWQAMRAKNPLLGLKARARELKKRSPELARRLAFASKVVRVGWAVIAPAKRDYAYTIGLAHLPGLQDGLIHAPGPKTSARRPLGAGGNALAAELVGGARLKPGGTLGGLRFEAFGDAELTRFPCEALVEFEWLFADVHHTRGSTLPLVWATKKSA